MAKQRASGLTKEDLIEEVTDAWRASDNAKAFVQALADKGYMLATGKRPYVLVDFYGGMYALPRLIADKSVRTNDIREFLGKDYELVPVRPRPQPEEGMPQEYPLINVYIDIIRYSVYIFIIRLIV